MSDLILISDGEDDEATPPSKRARKNPFPTILNLDTDPIQPGSASTPLFVDETPLSDPVTVVKSSFGSGIGVSSRRENNFSGMLTFLFVILVGTFVSDDYADTISSIGEFGSLFYLSNFVIPDEYSSSLGFYCVITISLSLFWETGIGKPVITLESDSEDSPQPGTSNKSEPVHADSWKQRCRLESGSSDADSDDNISWMQRASFRSSLSKDAIEVDSDHEKEDTSVEKMGSHKQTRSPRSTSLSIDSLQKTQMSKDEKVRATEEKKLRKEQEKLQKAASKAEDAEHKKLEKEKKKWANEKALKSIVAMIDNKVAEGSVGGRLISGLKEKGITYRITPNPIEGSIVWTMTIPEDIAQTFPLGPKIPYVLLVSEADDFCNLVADKELLENVYRVREEYPSYTMCYLTNKLLSYLNKKERVEYNDPLNRSSWRKPPIDEALAKLTTHYIGVHSRHCVDEAEVAEHVVGLTSNLAYCQVRNKLTRISVNADSTLMSKNAVDKHLIRESTWLKALVAIPKVQPRYAVAVSKKYPSMKSLLKVYMDPNISIHEKEFLLKDLKVERLVGGDTRVGEVCSKRIYRVLMSHDGAIKTDDVENGAASFTYDLN